MNKQILEANERAFAQFREQLRGGAGERETFDWGWEAGIEHADKAVAVMLAAFDRWNALRGNDPERDEALFRALMQTIAPLRAPSRS